MTHVIPVRAYRQGGGKRKAVPWCGCGGPQRAPASGAASACRAMNTHHALSWTPSRPRWRPKMMPQREPPAYLRASVTAAITDLDPSSAAPTRSTAITKPNAAAVRAATSAWLCRVCIIVLVPSYRGWHVGPGVDEPILQRGRVGKGFGSRELPARNPDYPRDGRFQRAQLVPRSRSSGLNGSPLTRSRNSAVVLRIREA